METTKPAQTGGCWDLRGPDYETALIGPSVSEIWDADRLVRTEWRNGFPNWGMYRCALAGDSLLLGRLREWVVAFSVAYCLSGGVKRKVYSEELACVAGWDALHILLYTRQLQPYTVTAEALEVDPKTYARLRAAIHARLRASLDEYWVRLQVAFRQVSLVNRKI